MTITLILFYDLKSKDNKAVSMSAFLGNLTNTGAVKKQVIALSFDSFLNVGSHCKLSLNSDVTQP